VPQQRPQEADLEQVGDRAAPGVVAGCIGLVLASVAMLTELEWLVGLAGVMAFVAGLLTVLPARKLRRTRASVADAHARAEAAEAEGEEMAARAARFEAEARSALTQLNEVGAAGPPLDMAQVTDEETGLFNEAFFAVTLEKRVSAARRGLRPLSLALLEPVEDVQGDAARAVVDRDVAECILDTLRDSDIACRLEGPMLAVILEDTPENGAVWTVERIRRRVAAERPEVALRAGVACYPAHAFDAGQVMAAAEAALRSARDWHQDRIEVATNPED
jgi:diguanylate cyclase (GGDEF)-like protein